MLLLFGNGLAAGPGIVKRVAHRLIRLTAHLVLLLALAARGPSLCRLRHPAGANHHARRRTNNERRRNLQRRLDAQPSPLVARTRRSHPCRIRPADGAHPDYEVDHFVPLGIGGADDDANLWPEPRRSIEPTWNAERKDELEWKLRDLVCSGALDVQVAQKAISSDWTEAFKRYVGAVEAKQQ